MTMASGGQERGQSGQVAVAGLDIDAVDVAWHHPERVVGPAVLLTHGAGGDLDDQGLVALATSIAAAGHLAVRCNMPYRQRRPEGPPPRVERGLGELATVIAGVAQAVPDVAAWVLGGKSYGGRLATMVAAGAQGVDLIVARDVVPRPVGVLCYSYPLHPPRTPDKVRVAHWSDIDVPVLFLQGSDDPFGGPVELVPHLALLAADPTVVPVPGGDHSLHVPRTRSADGATHLVPEVIARLAPDCVAWLNTLPQPAA